MSIESLVAERLQLKARNRQLAKDLVNLTRSMKSLIELIDSEMAKPSTPERGKRIAGWLNSAEMHNDHIRHFTLDIDLKTGKRRRKKATT